jgi:chaperonin cofactor prefoldin
LAAEIVAKDSQLAAMAAEIVVKNSQLKTDLAEVVKVKFNQAMVDAKTSITKITEEIISKLKGGK